MPTISIITPTYNRADVLPETIDSVLNQTLENYEYFIVDDASTDNTEQIVRSYEDERVKYIELSENQGANAARNRGIEEARGQYITFLDSDDKYLPQRLEVTSSLLHKLDEDIIGVSHSFESAFSGNVVRRNIISDGRITATNIQSGNLIGGFSNVMFKSDIFDTVGDLDEEMPAYQDYEFYLRALEHGDMYGISDVLCEKRKGSTDDSSQRISNNITKKKLGQNLLIQKHGEKLSKQVHASFYYIRGRLYMRDGKITEGRKSFRTALSLYPYHPLYYYNYAASVGGRRIFKTAQKIKRKIGIALSRI